MRRPWPGFQAPNAPFSGLLLQRVRPAQPAEAAKIGVSGANLATVLDGQRRQVRVRRDIAPRPQRLDQPAKYREMTIGRVQNDGAGLPDPAFDDVESLTRIEGICEELRPGGKPEEREQDGPRKANRFRSRQDLLDPGAGARVVG